MEGTLVNAAAVVLGGLLGVLAGNRIPARARETIMMGIGLATITIGAQMALQTQDVIGVIVSLAVGGVLGEAIGIERGLDALGRWAERRVGGGVRETRAPDDGSGAGGRIAAAFVASSLLFCVGPMTVLGAVQDGLGQPPTLLYTKAVLDGISATAIGAALGIGVLLSAVTIVVYQGAITLAAGLIQSVLSGPMTRELSAVGGVLIIGLGLGILQIRRIRVGSLLPALLVAVLWAAAAPWLHGTVRRLGL